MAFFLRTQASAEVREVAEDAKAAEAERKDAFWRAAAPGTDGPSRVDFVAEGVQVEAIRGRGRGLRAQARLQAGAIVLRERPLAATLLEAADAERPMAPVARLAGALIEHGLEPLTRILEPRPGHDYLEHPARAQLAAELTRGLAAARSGANAAAISDEDGERLLLTILLNSHGVAHGGKRFQGLFSVMGAMANHSSSPNLIFQGAGGEDLFLVFRAARDIEPGEELTISYLEELYLPYPERADRLQELHCFAAERLPTDASLEAMSGSLPEEQRQQATQRVVAANSAADEAWEKMAALTGVGEADEKELQRLRGLCISAYAAVLNANLLAETHSWRFNATWRLALLLTQDSTPEACKKSLPLWDSALRCGLRVWPSELWPEHQPLLRGAARAAAAAQDETRIAAYKEQQERIDALLQQGALASS